MDIQRLEDEIATRALQAEARAQRKEAAAAATRRKERAKLVAAAREVTTGTDDGGHWLAFPADTDPEGIRALGVVVAILLAAGLGAPLFVWFNPWLLLPWFLLAGGVGFWAGLRYGRERPVRLLVTPRGYWAFFDGARLRASGRVEDLRLFVGGTRRARRPGDCAGCRCMDRRASSARASSWCPGRRRGSVGSARRAGCGWRGRARPVSPTGRGLTR